MFCRSPCSTLWLVWIASCAMASPAIALDPTQELHRFIHRSWGVEQGLPHGSVRSLAQTPDDYLWVGTQAGLARFDGSRFEVFDHRSVAAMANDQIECMAVDARGVLWLGTYGGGLLRYEQGRFRHFGRDDGLPAPEVMALALDPDQRLWVATFGGGISVLDQGRLQPAIPASEIPEPAVMGLVFDPSGDLYFFTPGQVGHRRRGQDKVELFGAGHGLPPAARLRAIAVRAEGGLWVATDAGLLSFVDGRFAETFGGHGPTRILALHADAGGAVWLGTARGLLRTFPARGTIEAFERPHPNADTFSFELLFDRQGSLWLGTLGSGLHQLHESDLRAWRRQDGLSSDFVTSLAEAPDGALWITTRNAGLNRLDPRTGKVADVSAGLPDLDLWSVAVGEAGELWVGSSGRGLLRRGRDGAWRSYGVADGLGRGAVFGVHRTRDGTVWAATNRGLGRLEGERFRNFTELDGLPSEEIRALFEDRQGRLWVGTRAGLAVSSPGGRTFFEPFGADRGFGSYAVLSIWQDEQDALWMAAAGALIRVADGRSKMLTTLDGLYDDELSYVIGDQAGFLWLGTARGLVRIALADLRARLDSGPGGPLGDPGELHQWVLDRRDGAPGIFWNQGTAVLLSRTQTLYFGSRGGGVTALDPRRVAPRPRPEVRIEDATVETLAWEPLHPWLLGDSRASFRFGAVELLAPHAVHLRYRLEGFEETWRQAQPEGRVTYRQVPPGKYRFVVAASDGEGRFGPPIHHEFEVERRWGPLLGLMGSALLLVVSVAWLGHRWRIGLLRSRERDLERRVEQALADLKSLRGMLPICCACKRIRDDAGYWKDLESYVVAHSELGFRRGTCPDCERRTRETRPAFGALQPKRPMLSRETP